MLDLIPNEFWSEPRKVFEPAVGKGGFLVDVVERFMKGLAPSIPDEEERIKIIIEECIYFADVNLSNLQICSSLMRSYSPSGDLEINYYHGDSLGLDVIGKWGFQFDLVVGNPPYNKPSGTGASRVLWNKFVEQSLENWVVESGYLLFVHPAGWRKPSSKKGKYPNLFKLMTVDNQMLEVVMNDLKTGQKVFNCGTRFDYYLIQKTKATKPTKVTDYKGESHYVELSNYEWYPNYNFEFFNQLLAGPQEERCRLTFSRIAYGTDKPWLSHKETDTFKYPVIYKVRKEGPMIIYSSTNKNGHYGIPKVVFGRGGINEPYTDLEGKYAVSSNCMFIEVTDIEEAKEVIECLKSKKFDDLVKSCTFSIYGIESEMFRYYRRLFYKEFIAVE